MKVLKLTPQQQQQVAALQQQFKQAQDQHLQAYRALANQLQQISGIQPEKGGKLKIGVSDDGQHLLIGRHR